jgi:hypothetical protein
MNIFVWSCSKIKRHREYKERLQARKNKNISFKWLKLFTKI